MISNNLKIRPWPGSPFWYYDFTLNGKRHRGSTGLHREEYSEEDAYRITLIDMHIDDGQLTPGEETLLWLKRYMERTAEREGLRDGTTKLYVQSIDRLIALCGSLFRVKDVRKLHVEQLQDNLLGNGCSPAYVNLVCRHLRGAFQRLVDNETIDRNPFSRFKKVAIPDDHFKHLNAQHLAAFLKSVAAEKNEAIRNYIYLLLLTGRRRSEFLHVQREDVDLENRVISIVNIKDRRQRHQLIDLDDATHEIVKWFLNRTRSSLPFKICTANNISRVVKKHMRAADLPEKYHLHSLRHTFITHALQQGEDIYRIKEHVGHSTVRITESYAHDRQRGPIKTGFKIDVQ